MNLNHMITPEGTKEYLFEECLLRREMENRLSQIYTSRGYGQIVTPTLEFYDTFSGQIPGEMMLKLTDHKNRLMVLRPDSTAPAVRLAATRLKNHLLPIRLFYHQNVFRSGGSDRHQKIESLQSGAELIGANGIRADLEIICAALDTLAGTSIGNFHFELGHVGFFKALMKEVPMSKEEHEMFRELINSKNYAALKDLVDRHGNNAKMQAAGMLPQLFGGVEVFQNARKIALNEAALAALDYLEELYDNLVKMGYGDLITVDLGLVQKINYYSEIVFSAYVEGFGEALLSGGRYDHLSRNYGIEVPAAGFAVNFNLLCSARMQNGGIPQVRVPDVLIHYDMEKAEEAIARSRLLEEEGMIVELSVFQTIREAKEYADVRGIKRVVVIVREGTEG